MDSILSQAYVERKCMHCGDQLHVSLYDVMQQYRLQDDWTPARSCSSCSVDQTFLLGSLPKEPLARIQSAWDELLQAAAEHGIELRLGK